MTAEDAKRLVFQHVERNRINISWLAGELGLPRQTVHQWLRGGYEPRDPQVWIRMATVLDSVPSASNDLLDRFREFALDVLVHCDHPEIKAKAAELIRESSR